MLVSTHVIHVIASWERSRKRKCDGERDVTWLVHMWLRKMVVNPLLCTQTTFQLKFEASSKVDWPYADWIYLDWIYLGHTMQVLQLRLVGKRYALTSDLSHVKLYLCTIYSCPLCFFIYSIYAYTVAVRRSLGSACFGWFWVGFYIPKMFVIEQRGNGVPILFAASRAAILARGNRFVKTVCDNCFAL